MSRLGVSLLIGKYEGMSYALRHGYLPGECDWRDVQSLGQQSAILTVEGNTSQYESLGRWVKAKHVRYQSDYPALLRQYTICVQIMSQIH